MADTRLQELSKMDRNPVQETEYQNLLKSGGGSTGGFPSFSFDEALARSAATQEYSPYYEETLKDYMANVENTKSRSVEDTDKLLALLGANKEYFVGTERRLLDNSIKSTNEGYAGRGLFFSGARPKDIKELQTISGEKVNDYMTGYNYNTEQASTKNTRTLADATTAATQYQRDLEREKKYQIESGVITRKQEALSEYNTASQNYYNNYYANMAA